MLGSTAPDHLELPIPVEHSGDPTEHFSTLDGCILEPLECFGHVLTTHTMDDKLSPLFVCAVLAPTPGALGGSVLMA